MPHNLDYETRSLKYRWKLWLNHSDAVATTTERFTILASFNTVSDFWRIFQELRPITHCNGCQYWLFKDGCSPNKQHVTNRNGGRWIIDLKHSEIRLLFNFYQLKLLFSLILGHFDDYEESICGCKAEARNDGCRLALWLNDGTDLTRVNEIGGLMKERLFVTEDKQFYFESSMFGADQLNQKPLLLTKKFVPYVEVLESKWKLILGKLSKNPDEQRKQFVQLAILNNMREFWCIFDKIRKPSKLKPGYSYYMLKINMNPLIMDENGDGGRWVVEVPRDTIIANFSWLTLMLSLLLNRFGTYGGDMIGGVIETFKKKFEISLWNNDCSNVTRILKIGEILKKEFGRLADDCGLRYETQRLYLSRKSYSIQRYQTVAYDEDKLKNCWTLYLYTQNESTNWLNCFTTIASFDTLREFWKQISHLRKPSSGMAYYCFKSTIRPNWDDENNLNGGRWAIDINQQEAIILLDFYWLALLLALMLGRFGSLDESICGAVVRVKKKRCKVSLWTREIADETLSQIGEVMKRELSITNDRKLYYEKHENARSRSDSHIKPLLSIPSVPPLQ